MPGDVGTITITIKNTATKATQTDTATYTSGGTTTTTTTTTDINADIESVYLYGREIEVISGNYRYPGELGTGQSMTITFAIKAPTKDGIYFPEVWIDVLGGRSVKYPIPIKVDSSSVAILASDVPSSIPIGDLSEIELSIANRRPNSINATSIAPSAEGIEFTPTEIFLGAMKPDEMSTVKFTLDPISIGRKDISFELTYKNGDNIHSKSLTCSIDVADSPGVRLILVETPTSVYKGQIARISLDVANAKLSEITGVSVIPVTEVVLAPSEAFIGTMEPDDVFSANFDIDTTDLSLGKHDIDFKVAYKDGERFYETAVYTVSFNVVEAPTTELPPIPLLISILVVVAIVTGYCVYRRKRSKTQ